MAQISLAPRAVTTGKFVGLFAATDRYTGPTIGALRITYPSEKTDVRMDHPNYDFSYTSLGSTDGVPMSVFELRLAAPDNTAAGWTRYMAGVMVSFKQPGTYTFQLQFGTGGGALRVSSAVFTATAAQTTTVDLPESQTFRQNRFEKFPIFGPSAMSGPHGTVRVEITSKAANGRENDENLIIEWDRGSITKGAIIPVGDSTDSLDAINKFLASITLSSKKTTHVNVKVYNNNVLIVQANIHLVTRSMAVIEPVVGAYCAVGGLVLGLCVALAVRKRKPAASR